jgi:hypothetical protein
MRPSAHSLELDVTIYMDHRSAWMSPQHPNGTLYNHSSSSAELDKYFVFIFFKTTYSM